MGSILGFSTNRSPSRIGVRTYKVPGTSVYVPVRAEVAPLLIGFLAEFHRTVEPLRAGWCWGFAFRAIRDSVAPSRHSAGIAVDFNAPRHPLGRRGTFNARQVAQIRALARKYGLRWGGDYRGRADEMHVEVNETRTAALARVRRLQGAPAVSRPAPAVSRPPAHVHPWAPAMPLLRPGANDKRLAGSPVADLQGHLNAWRAHRGLSKMARDGDYGPTTAYCVRVFQQAYHVSADGICGPKTWALVHQHSNGKIA